jgi:hypothetical protein
VSDVCYQDGTPSTQLAALRAALKTRTAAEKRVAEAMEALGRLLPGPVDYLVVTGQSYNPCAFRLTRRSVGEGLSVTIEPTLCDYELDRLAHDNPDLSVIDDQA